MIIILLTLEIKLILVLSMPTLDNIDFEAVIDINIKESDIMNSEVEKGKYELRSGFNESTQLDHINNEKNL